MYSSSGEPCNFIISVCAASSGECISTKKLLSAPLTILIGLSTESSRVSQSLPPFVSFPVGLEESVGLTEISYAAPPTPSNGVVASLKSIGNP